MVKMSKFSSPAGNRAGVESYTPFTRGGLEPHIARDEGSERVMKRRKGQSTRKAASYSAAFRFTKYMLRT